MIEIILDPHQFLDSQHAEVLEDVSQYPAYWQKVQQAILAHENLRVLVHPRIVVQWFKNMAKRYPQGTFSFEEMDARRALQERWGMTIPDHVSNAEIEEVGLLTLQIDLQPGLNFEDSLLRHFYAPIYCAMNFPFTKLPALLGAVDVTTWKQNRAIPLLGRILDQRIRTWREKAGTTEQRHLVARLAEDPAALRKDLMQYRVLEHYPNLGETMLDEAYYTFRRLKLPLDPLELDEKLIQDCILQVTYELNKQQLAAPSDVLVLLEKMSGLLRIEFETIESALRNHPDWINEELMATIEDVFRPQYRRIRRNLIELREMIQPPKPDAPESNWGVDDMLTWATQSYLPYQAWCVKQGQFDEELYKIGDQFSEWVMDNWHDLHANSKRMVFNILPNKATILKDEDYVNLILVVDNLGWSLSHMLKDLFQGVGYFLGSAEPYFAMLPTETETSKKCLLSGAVGYQAIDNKSYKGMLEKGLVPFFGDQAFRYISDIGSLKDVKLIDARTYVVNYLAVDKTLHKSTDEVGMPHHEHIQHLLEKLVENCDDFIQKHNLKERIRIHVVSDHGSTCIPEDIQNNVDQDFFKAVGFPKRSHRYVCVTPERFQQLADNLRLDCFFLPANDFMNPEDILCARQANRFLKTGDDFFVHGGLLPEELIVPSLVFEPVTEAVQELTVLLQQNEFRYRRETVALDIGNPNTTVVENILVTILNGNVECEPGRIVALNSMTKENLTIKARFKMARLAEEQTNLMVRIRYTAHGEHHSFDKQLPIMMRKLVEETSSDIFDF